MDTGTHSTDTDYGSLPEIVEIGIVPQRPLESDLSVLCQAVVEDADTEQSELSVEYEWYDQTFTNLLGYGASLDISGLDPGISFACIATPFDGVNYGLDGVAYSTKNTRPTTSLPSLSQDPALSTSPLVCSASGSDDEGDTVVLSFVWKNDSNTEIGNGDTLDIAPLILDGTLTEGQTITCEVTSDDGFEEGAVQSVSTTINHRPVVSVPTLSPTPVSATETSLACSAVGSDGDGNLVTLSYVWMDGSNTQLGTGETLNVAALVESNHLSDAASLACQVTPHDGLENGTSQSISSTVIDPRYSRGKYSSGRYSR